MLYIVMSSKNICYLVPPKWTNIDCMYFIHHHAVHCIHNLYTSSKKCYLVALKWRKVESMYFRREKNKRAKSVFLYGKCVKKRNVICCRSRELLKKQVPFAHYLVENKTAWHCTHVLSSAPTQMPHTVLPAKQNQKATISFHPPLPNK
jgi:hypothetical protein